MAKDGTWGDHVVLLAAANYFQTPIRIISSLDREIVVHREHAVADSTPLVLGHIHEFHYVSLQPRQGRTFFLIISHSFLGGGLVGIMFDEFIFIYQLQRTLQDDDNAVNVFMR